MFLIIYPAETLLTVIFFLHGILIVGIERISIGVSSLSSAKKTRYTNTTLGIAVIGLSIFLMEFPIYTDTFLIILAGVALLVSGIARVVQGISRDIPRLFKGLNIGVGALSIVISFSCYNQSCQVWFSPIGNNVSNYTSDSRNRDDFFRS